MVRVTLFAPTSAQVKLFGETLKEAIAQLSVLPLSISAAIILATPLASNWTVNGATQLAIGTSVSFMVTSKEQVCTGFIPSSYSKVFVVVPTGKVLPLGRPAVWVMVPLAAPKII